MTDLNIRQGLSTELFIDGVVNPNIVIEEGCWYLCTDTAELYLGVLENTGNLALKQINNQAANRPSDAPTDGEATRGVIGAYINDAGELCLVFSDDTEESLGRVVGADGKDGLTTAIKMGETLYEHVDGVIELPGFVTKEYVDEQIASINLPKTDLSNYYNKEEINDLIDGIEHPSNPTKVSELENDANYATEQYVIDAIANHISVEDLAKKEEVEEVKTKLETEVLPIVPTITEEVIPAVKELAQKAATQEWVQEQGYLTEHQDLSEYAKSATVVAQKYEVLPVEGMLITYRDDEVRLNTQRVVPTQQNVGPTGDPNTFNIAFRAYAPEGATKVIEGIVNGTTGEVTKDVEFSALAVDSYGRKYTTIWAAIAQYTGSSWLNYGGMSTVEKYLGHRYIFDWYNEDKIIGSDRFNVILTNDTCHNDSVPEAVVKRIKTEVEAVEAKIPDISELSTKAELQEAIDAIEHPTVDLSAYYTSEQTEERLQNYVTTETYDINQTIINNSLNNRYNKTDADKRFALKADLNELAEKVDAIQIPEVSLDGYATEAFVQDEIAKIDIPNVDEFITEAEVDAKGFLTEHQSLEGYAKLGDIPSLEGYATNDDVAEAISELEIPSVDGLATQEFVNEAINAIEIPDISNKADAEHTHTLTDITDYVAPDFTGYATEEFVNKKIAEAELADKEADLEAYYTKSEVDAITSKFVTSIPEEYITAEELASEGFLKEHQDISHLAEKGHTHDDYAEKEHEHSQYLTEHQSLDGYATETYVQNAIAEAELAGKDVDLSGLATKDDIKDLASVSYVDEKIASIEHPSIPTKISELENDSGFITSIPDEYVTEEELSAKGFITEHQSLSDYAKKDELFSKSYNDLTDRPEIPSIVGLATEKYVDDAIAGIELPEVPTNVSEFVNDAGYLTEHQDISGKADKSELNTLENIVTEVSNAVDSKADSEHTHALSEITDYVAPDLTGYALKSEIPSVDGFATEEFVAEAIADIELPETDLSDYYTKTEMSTVITNAIASKADKIPFAVDKFVTKPIGGFAAGDNLNGLPLIEILAKLLELSDVGPGTDTQGIVESIIANKTPMYAVTGTGTIEPMVWSDMLNYTEDTAVVKPEASGFYQITKDDGTVEYGYQQVSAVYADMPYIIALPKALDFATNVTVQSWNDLESKWIVDNTTKNAMSSDTALFESFGMGTLSDICAGVDTAEYTIWFLDVASTGIIYRFIINE